ncbi:calcitonin receptor [Patella vulgata]|uniref:calcitonin receptor n=1 Tax=Patella vulgata TaxID=6465 RepID=UPI002180482C|nr:calcitonin receptor [Patella vulgata]XP_050418452.1 calcitonin receptor [Patella vulgata]
MEEMCRDRVGLFNVAFYKLWTCAMCYSYLFRNEMELQSNGNIGLVSVNGTVFPPGTTLYPHIDNQTGMDMVCETLDSYDCYRWTSCCENAMSCCDRQRSTANYSGPGKYCPRTWDGFGCFDDTPASDVSYIKCPEYIDQANPMADATKTCTSNGTWYANPLTRTEWTNYTGCVKIDNFKILFQVGLICNIISIIFLVPACVIFLYYRQLRMQQRIKLHICLFSSFALTCAIMILWDVLVFNDRLEKPARYSIMYRDPHGCKILNILTRYAVSTTYVWMFLEGFHLHRLIVKAFKVPKSLLIYHIIGWGFSVIPIIGYTSVRITRNDKSCWVYHAGGYEWIVYFPNLVCIVANFFFLGNILRILMTQLQSHPNEPSNYRRALKATFILVPLFGLQLFLIIYRPPSSWGGSFVFEIVSKVATNTQGAIVAIIFCFLNGEVHTHLKGVIPTRFRQKPHRSELGRTNSVSTQYTMESTRPPSMRAKIADDKHSYIPLNTLVDDIHVSNGQQGSPIVRNKT